MQYSQSLTSVPSWLKTLLAIAFVAFVTSACKETMSGPSGVPMPPSGSPSPPGGMPAPPSGGPPSSPGGQQSPPGGQQSPPGGGMPSPPSGGSDGGSQPSGGMPPGSQGPSGSSDGADGADGSGGEVGAFPDGGGGEESIPPPPSERGGGGADGSEGGEPGEAGEAGDPSEWEEETSAQSECGDSGSMPGGIGGMGQEGDCLGGGGGGAGDVGEFPEESAAERAERLGRELDKSVGGFDEVLQEEQREVAAVGRNMEGFGGGAAGQGSADGGISLGEQAGGNDPVAVANTRMSRESPIDAMSQEEIRERTPDDIPIRVDDDIIARQLREAALAEDDPELRERLWEEYRKYSGI